MGVAGEAASFARVRSAVPVVRLDSLASGYGSNRGVLVVAARPLFAMAEGGRVGIGESEHRASV